LKKFVFFLVLLLFLSHSVIVPNGVYAYSYGDPNEEKVAEAYKEIQAKLAENPANYKAAKLIYETVQEEIDMHMGPEPSKVILKDFEKENKDEIISDMQKILVLNISRRMESIEKNIEEYDTSKKLLAKAFATYEALSPIVAEKDKSLDQKLKDKFDESLVALGNPGLFGVGKKETDPNMFKENKQLILKELQEQFELESLEVGHFTESANEDHQAAGESQDWTDLSNIKNWLPLIVLVLVIAGVIVYAVRKRR
jgi:hypothetical protein